MRPKHLIVLPILLVLAAVLAPTPAHAGGVVDVCDEVHLLVALVGGGTVTFSCSGTIILANTIEIRTNTTIDGSGQSVIISGNHAMRVFIVYDGWRIGLNLNGVTVADGSTRGSGGGIYNFSTLTISNSTFSGNTTREEDGGAIYNLGTLIVNNSTFSGNTAHVDGGAIHNHGTLIVNNSAFSGNTGNAGGINNQGKATVNNSIFSGNIGWAGGGIFNGNTLTVTHSIFSGNTARQGGGIDNNLDGIATISDSTFSDNTTIEGGSGGGISNFDTATITNSTFSGNTADGGGGGIYNNGTLTASNSTFSGNTAKQGGGISNSGRLALNNVTLSSNSADPNSNTTYHGDRSSMAWFRNTIFVANNLTGSSCGVWEYGSITDEGGNLSYPDATCPGINRDPKLGPLQDNGGPTYTMALLPGSAAIDAGSDARCAAAPVNNLDQRGITRPQGPHCDIGAYEAIILPMLPRAYLPIILE